VSDFEVVKISAPVRLKVKKLHPDAQLPKYATAGAACFDLVALTMRASSPLAGNQHVYGTGLAVEVPSGWVLKIYSRSGHGFKHATRLSNCVGIIDSDYRGELLVALQDDSGSGAYLNVKMGDRIAQAMLERVESVEFVEVDELSETARGTGGFGSTGA